MNKQVLILNDPNLDTKCSYKKSQRILIFALLYVSFVFMMFFDTISLANGGEGVLKEMMGFDNDLVNFVLFTMTYALVSLFVFEVIMRLYVFLIRTSIYTFSIPREELRYSVRIWFMLRNSILAVINCFLLVYPITINYFIVVQFIIDSIILIMFFFDIRKRFISEITAPFAFKTFVRPYLVYQVVSVILVIAPLVSGVV